MSNIIDDIDLGMGYEWTCEWGLRNQYHTVEGWVTSACPDQEAMNLEMAKGVVYRRKLPILANHPEAIPLEPGEELIEGENYLMRNGVEVFDLQKKSELFVYSAFDASVGGGWSKFGSTASHPHPFDIIARLPKVAKEADKRRHDGHNEYCSTLDAGFAKVTCDCGAEIDIKASQPESEAYREMMGSMSSTPPEEPWNPEKFTEAEKAKEEKVSSSDSWLNVGKWKRYEHYGVSKVEIPPSEAARLYLENESVRAEVQRQEEAKRITKGDLVVAQGGPIFRARQVENNQVTGDYVAWITLDRCRKLDLPPGLIAALNAEIDRKAGG